MIPLVPSQNKVRFDEWPSIEDMKRNLKRFATKGEGRFAGTNKKPSGLVDLWVCARRIAAQRESHVQACEYDTRRSIRRLASTMGRGMWEHDIRAGTVRVT